MVDDLDDGREAAGLELEDTANLNEAPGAGTDLDIRHFSCRSELGFTGSATGRESGEKCGWSQISGKKPKTPWDMLEA